MDPHALQKETSLVPLYWGIQKIMLDIIQCLFLLQSHSPMQPTEKILTRDP